MEKSCTKCGEVKPIENFAVVSKVKSGRAAACKECERARGRKKYEKNRDKILAHQKKHREDNRDKYLARERKYYEENREKYLARDKKYREENHDKHLARGKKYYQENRDEIAARNKKYREENREKVAARAKRYYEENRDKHLARDKKYCAENPEKKAAAVAKRRSAKIERIPSWSNDDDLKAIKKIYARCKRINKLTGVEHQVDHVIPLQGDSISGLHHSTNLAIIPAALNRSKKNKWEFQEVHYG